MIVIDTLRADRLGCYGNSRGLTPFLDSVAARGTVFENAHAASSWTVPSIASLFTSRYASQHGVATMESKLAADEVTLAERLGFAGYVTGGFSANLRLSRKHGYPQGFQDWRAYVPPRADMPAVRGDRLRLDALEWFARVRDEKSGRPMFLYLQYMEPHSPYDPPQPYRSRFAVADADAARQANDKIAKLRYRDLSDPEAALLESLYDGEVAAVDEEIRLLFERFERRAFFQNAIVVITADHGEEFGQHRGVFGHGLTLYQGEIRVPLLVVAPGFSGGVVSSNVSLLDVAPTVLELAGLAPEPRFEGRSLVPLMKSATSGIPIENDGDILSELPRSGSSFDLRRHTRAFRTDSHKVLTTPGGSTLLYDLAQDPSESDPIAAESSPEGEILARSLAERVAVLERHTNPEPQRVDVDEATREKLRALGYHD